jgi:hypothetical protein
MNPLTKILTYAGGLPFVIGAACLYYQVTSLPYLGNTEQALSVYILIIASFIAGSYWGLQVSSDHKESTNLALFSNIVALLLWVSFLRLSFHKLIFLYAFTFIAFLLIDSRLHRLAIIKTGYYHLRCRITLVAVFSLCSIEVMVG